MCGESIAKGRGAFRKLVFRFILIMLILYILITSVRMFG